MFVGRKAHLASLQALYDLPGSTSCAVYGRRRVGKTSMLSEFCKGKPSLFLTALQYSAESTLEDFSDSISEFLQSQGRPAVPPLKSLKDLLSFLSTIDREEKTVVVIDEFPFLIDNFEAVADRFRTWMDHRMQECNVMLIICGSSMSTMLDTLNDTDSPLYGRFETQLRVDPLPYREARLLNPGLDEADRMRIYAIAGGVPGYHRKFGSSTPEKGIERLFLGEMPWGTTESDSSMILDFKGDLYGRVLGAIQGGAEAAVIAQRASTSVQMCSKALDKLVLLGFVRKDISHGKRKGAIESWTESRLSGSRS